jgi:hypothetical protein
MIVWAGHFDKEARLDWFNVDKEGLAKLLQRRGPAWPLFELASNGLDTNATHVAVTVEALPGIPRVKVEVVDDDPNGFANLAHAYTLFAESNRKGDAEKRGRFNLGEKITLALCDEATIESTTGSVTFDADGRHQRRFSLGCGSRFCGVMRMTRDDMKVALADFRRLIPPLGIAVTLNGEKLPDRVPAAVARASLLTEVADNDGVLRRSTRSTTLTIYEPQAGEVGTLYEMGIPVVETGDRWHVNVGQKVPLTFERDNVPPSYLRNIRVVVLNEMAHHLTKDDANATWVRDAGSDPDASDVAMTKVMDLRFGEKRVIFDPSDPEANFIAASKGYTLIHGGMLNGNEWDNVRRAGAALPAGQVTPSPKPFSPYGEPLRTLPPEKWTPAIKRVVEFATVAGSALSGTSPYVTVANDIAWPFAAAYAPGHLTLNLGRLGHKWFDSWPNNEDVERLLIHEFAHGEPGGDNHLSHEYHEALCRMGAKMTRLALTLPELWK